MSRKSAVKRRQSSRRDRKHRVTMRTTHELNRNGQPTNLGPRPVNVPNLPSLPNMQDNFVIEKLSTASLGSLDVDQFGHLLSKKGKQSDEDRLIELRLGLIRVYLDSAHARLVAKASRDQIKSAKSAMKSLFEAASRLDQAKPVRQRGLQGIFGSPLDDPKGFDELNEFGSKCWDAKLQITSIAMTLGRAISSETVKVSSRGERKKRLRTLVESLADWWKSAIKKSLAPYVKAKRLGRRRTFVLGRGGAFIELATAMFSKVDEFKESEVISAVTNVYETQLANRTKSKSKRNKK
jgi:hypothetical protein